MELSTKLRTVRKKAKRIARCRTGKETATQERTAFHAANGFLTHQFTPVMADMPEQLEIQEEVESGFYTSLSNLEKRYGFTAERYHDLVYPCNIAATWEDVLFHMETHLQKTGIAIVQGMEHAATITTFKTFHTGSCLYYIPLRPLWDLMHDKKRRKAALLLLSVFAYLYQVLRISDYTKTDSTLYYTYLTLEEWYHTDGETEKDDLDPYWAALRTAKKTGKSVINQINKSHHLQQFHKRLKYFQAENDADKKLMEMAMQCHALYNKYGNRSFWQSIHLGMEEPQEMERISPDEYLSFVWDCEDMLIEDIMEYTNNSLSERITMDEPLALQCFDCPQQEIRHDLGFEVELFTFLDNFIHYLLYDF